MIVEYKGVNYMVCIVASKRLVLKSENGYLIVPRHLTRIRFKE